MKILVVTTRSPYPLFEGRALRSYHLIRQAAKAHEVHLLSFVQTQEDLDGLEHMRTVCPVVAHEKLYFRHGRAWLLLDAARELFSRSPLQVMKYRSRALQRRMRAMMAEHHYDLVHLDMVHLAEYLSLCEGRPSVLMVHNVESVILQRRAETQPGWLARLYLRYQCRKLAAFEAEACRRAGKVVAVSALDAAQLGEMSGLHNVAAVPNGVDTHYFDAAGFAGAAATGDADDADGADGADGAEGASGTDPVASDAAGLAPERLSLVFVGGFSWFPNRDAIVYFQREILPLIAAQVPQVCLKVIGSSPPGSGSDELLRDPRIEVLGRIDDIRPVVAAAAAYIVPLRIGGGTRLKILDALALSKAIVSSSIGAEGLAVTHGLDIVLADTPETFAHEVVRLLRDPAAARALGRNGRQLAEQRYDWDVIGHGLRDIYASLAGVEGAQPAAAAPGAAAVTPLKVS